MKIIYIVSYWDGESDKNLKAFYSETDADNYINSLVTSNQFTRNDLYKELLTIE
jgi:hypothetical protein